MSPRHQRWRRRAKFVAVGLLAWLVAVGAWWSLREGIGAPDPATADAWHQGHRIVDRNGQLLRELPTDHGRRGRPMSLEALGARVVTTTIVSEDADFFEHDGVDRVAILRAAIDNVTSGRVVSGASTITQQLVKLLDSRGVPGRRTLGVKIDEAARAQNLESTLSKSEILVEYINRLPYGHGLVGPESAAQGYFGVRASHLSWAQAAFLAVLPRAPAAFDPFDHYDRVISRQTTLLEALHDEGHLDDAALRRALAETVSPQPVVATFEAPHFVQTLLAEDRLGPDAVTHTTLDLALQQDVQGLVTTHMATMKEFAAHDAAVLVIDNESAEVLAWVGSADFFDDTIAGQVDMVRARRQPGSTLKPFVYALGLRDGMTTSDMIADVPTSFAEGPGHAYVPQNFHRGFVGPVAVREALAASLNVPPVRLLAEYGADKLLTLLHELGVESLTESADHYGVALALGSGEMTLRELGAAYATLARGGRYLPLRYTDAEPEVASQQVLSAPIAAALTEALADPLARARLVQGRSPFSIGMPVAVKTGTSSGYRDAWTAGYTRERTVVVWVGNADGGPTHNVTGAHGAGGLFGDVMRRAMRDVGTHAPLWDDGLLESAAVCPLTGKRPGDACPHAINRLFPVGHTPQASCESHVHGHREPAAATGWVCDPEADAALVVLPADYDVWLHGMPVGAPGKDADGLPWLAVDDVPGCGSAIDGPPMLQIVEPAEGAVVWAAGPDDRVHLVADVRGNPAFDGKVQFVVDGRVVATTAAPYQALVRLSRGDHEVLARPLDPDARFVLQASAFAVR